MYESLPLFPILLPSVPFEDLKSLPVASGIYFALDELGNVLYVGATNNLQQRWRSHHQYQQLQQSSCRSVAYYVCPLDRLRETEQAMVLQFEPPLNSHFAQWYHQGNTPVRSLASNKKVTMLIPESLLIAMRVESEAHRRSLNAEFIWGLEAYLQTLKLKEAPHA